MKSPKSSPSPKKRKQSESQQDDPNPVVMDIGKLQEKRKKKCGSEEEEISVFTPPVSDAEMSSKKKKKKKKNKEQEEEELHVLSDVSVNDSKKKKKQKEILCEESTDTETADQQGGEADSGNSRRKKKKKKRREQGEDEIHVIPEESETETETNEEKRTADQHAGETESELLGIHKKKKKKKKRKEKEEVHAVEEDPVNEDPAVLAITEKKKKKKKRKLIPEEEEMHAMEGDSTIQSITAASGATKKKTQGEGEELPETTDSSVVLAETNSVKKKKKRRTQRQGEEEVHAVEEDSVVEELPESTETHAGDTNPAASAETNGVKKKKKKRRRTEEEDVEIQAEEHQNNTESPVSVATQTKMKKMKKERIESTCADTISEGRAKRAKQNVATNVTAKTKGGQKRAVPRKRGQGARRDSPADDVFDSELLDEMEEFLPDIRKQSDTKISRLLKLDLPRFRQFKKKVEVMYFLLQSHMTSCTEPSIGIPVRFGRFSEEENQRIRKNMADFQALMGISSVEKIVFPTRFEHEEKEIKKLRFHHHYVERIAEGIPRPCDQVSTRARKIFDHTNRSGRYSEEEVKTLVKLQNLHGNNWKVISEKMGRSIYSLEKRFSTCTQGHGAWEDAEVTRLNKALKDHLEELLQQNPESSGLTRDQLCDNLPWTEISQKVKTRHWTQCRLKWFSLLKTKLGTPGNSAFKRGPKANQAKIQLINTLHKMDLDDQAEIDWHEVAEAIGHSTPVCIQKTFHRLKKSRVPHWPTLSFGEIIDFLHGVVVPSLEKNLEVYDDEEDEEEEQQEDQLQEKKYKLSDVFGAQDEEEFVELDNS